ncbi:MAG: sulfate ABC transporter permease subunit CysT [Rudaea sp.]|uniref:sulfate ABC transporter permease subunit CysT n=1 Tax=unclassified Rudaea TaxID=2627037 RepID=UPI0010F4B7AA|nr:MULTISPECIES: sulfate ABC transporter permease subunit CysT [unclassified Rudaea]MBN8886556.1 sulfate ABC transporter permease subunit CysT [Rudaea sp.]MBR0343919.1 sulfate ABC transporter permease subunit CysT [Rudaea sp.]
MPGFGLTLGFTLSYLSLIVLIPLAALMVNAAGLGVAGIWKVLNSSQVLSALRLSFGGALIAAAINAVFGSLIAWTFVRYDFPGKRALQAMIDLPFALPTAVAGIALTALYSTPNGWLGVPLEAIGIEVAYTRLGVIVAMTFISLPFVVRTLEPVLEQIDKQYEEAAATLGATRWQAVSRIVFPAMTPALLTGTALAFARAVGEYGSIIFIAGNLPNLTQIAPLLIAINLDQHEIGAATAIAAAMLVLSFAILFCINLLQAWARRSGS